MQVVDPGHEPTPRPPQHPPPPRAASRLDRGRRHRRPRAARSSRHARRRPADRLSTSETCRAPNPDAGPRAGRYSAMHARCRPCDAGSAIRPRRRSPPPPPAIRHRADRPAPAATWLRRTRGLTKFSHLRSSSVRYCGDRPLAHSVSRQYPHARSPFFLDSRIPFRPSPRR